MNVISWGPTFTYIQLLLTGFKKINSKIQKTPKLLCKLHKPKHYFLHVYGCQMDFSTRFYLSFICWCFLLFFFAVTNLWLCVINMICALGQYYCLCGSVDSVSYVMQT